TLRWSESALDDPRLTPYFPSVPASAGRCPVGLEPVVLPLLARRLSLGRATGSTGPPRSTMTVSRQSGRLSGCEPLKESLQDTTCLYRVRKPSSSHNDQ